MDGIIADLIKETTTTTGTVLNIALAGDAQFGRFSDVAVAGQTVYYTIRNGNNSEVGIGTVQAGNTLDRTTPLLTIAGGVYDDTTPTRLNLVGASTVAISPSSFALQDLFDDVPPSFPSGTKMLFNQTAAPVGWTKELVHNDKALRVVTGTVGNGGTVAFSSAFAVKSVTGSIANHTLSLAQTPAHRHFEGAGIIAFGGRYGTGETGVATQAFASAAYSGTTGVGNYTQTLGSNGSHNHSFTGTNIDLSVQYVDLIIAVKD